MRNFCLFSLICVLSGAMLSACQRNEGVSANNQGSETYQPRVASKAPAADTPANKEIRGELVRVDNPRRTFTIRIENGMEQTFMFDDRTTVEGLKNPPVQAPAKADATVRSRVKDLEGKEGSELAIQWREETEVAKMATHISVTQLSTSKPGKSKKR